MTPGFRNHGIQFKQWHRVSRQVKQRTGYALGWTSGISANHPWALQRSLCLRSIWKEKSGYLMHRGTKRAESIRGCDLALSKHPGNICHHIHSIRHCACYACIFLWIFFLWCFITRKRWWKKLWKETRSNRQILMKIWKELGRFSPWEDCLVETVVAAVWLVFNDIEFRQRTKALYSSPSKSSMGMFLGLWKEIASSLARMQCVGWGKTENRLERNCGLNWNLLFWMVMMTSHASSGG